MRKAKMYLREWRDKRGFTQTELADALGVRQATISEIETGAVKMFRLDLLNDLARVLRTEPHKLLQPPDK